MNKNSISKTQLRRILHARHAKKTNKCCQNIFFLVTWLKFFFFLIFFYFHFLYIYLESNNTKITFNWRCENQLRKNTFTMHFAHTNNMNQEYDHPIKLPKQMHFITISHCKKNTLVIFLNNSCTVKNIFMEYWINVMSF